MPILSFICVHRNNNKKNIKNMHICLWCSSYVRERECARAPPHSAHTACRRVNGRIWFNAKIAELSDMRANAHFHCLSGGKKDTEDNHQATTTNNEISILSEIFFCFVFAIERPPRAYCILHTNTHTRALSTLNTDHCVYGNRNYIVIRK